MFFIWIVLLPVILLLIPVFVIACVGLGVRAWSALRSCWNVMNTLPGTRIEATSGTDSFAVVIH
ncbi:MAG TPA: hypothetical protein VL284_03025 [Thermoanaerobaculia bacterium]|nr:hypothetical protein [Thermoanaerobaculia bacterium]